MSALIGTAADPSEAKSAWLAVFALALGVFSFVTAEFLPANLLTPMAAALGVSEALVAQAITVTAASALVAAAIGSVVTRRLDRRLVLLCYSVLLIVSDLLVAVAPGLTFLLLARILLGIALGGFWGMATAVAMRLVPKAMVPRALSIVLSGVSISTIVAAPAAVFLGHLFGWRIVFLLAAGLGLVTLLLQVAFLPRLAPVNLASLDTLTRVSLRRGFGSGMLSAVMVFSGHFALFTYLRSYLEDIEHVSANTFSALLLGFGTANFTGNLIAGALLQHRLRLTLALMPLMIGVSALMLAVLHGNTLVCILVVALWGLAYGGVPVGWSTWVATSAPDEAESAGGLLVAAVEFAIGCGAAVGGVIFDLDGVIGVFTASGLLLLLTAALIASGLTNIKRFA